MQCKPLLHLHLTEFSQNIFSMPYKHLQTLFLRNNAIFICLILGLICSRVDMLAQKNPHLWRDTINVKVEKVIDADTYRVKYRNYEPFTVRLRMENPKDTVDSFDKNFQRAKKQMTKTSLSLDSVRLLARIATEFVDSVMKRHKYRVKLLTYPDQTVIGKDISFQRLLRGVVVDNHHIGDLLRERKLTAESRN